MTVSLDTTTSSGDIVGIRSFLERIYGPVTDGDAELRVVVDANRPCSVEIVDTHRLCLVLPGRLPSTDEIATLAANVPATMPPRLRSLVKPFLDAFELPLRKGWFLATPSISGLTTALLLRVARKRLAYTVDMTVLVPSSELAEAIRAASDEPVSILLIGDLPDDAKAAVLVVPELREPIAQWLDESQIARITALANRAELILETSWGPSNLTPIRIHGHFEQSREMVHPPEFYPHLNANGSTRLLHKIKRTMFDVDHYRFAMRGNAIGCEDAFGFRIPTDPATLADRPRNHLVVAISGGSVSWGHYCYDDENLSGTLERKLDSLIAELGLPLKASVLNFGQPGWTLMDETVGYMIHGALARPDAVISNSAVNDVIGAVIGDPDSLQARALILPLERICAKMSDQISNFLAPNAPKAVAQALVFRAAQFARMVEADGGRFLYGLQPYCADKPLTANEAAAMLLWRMTWGYGPLQQATRLNRMPMFYEQFRSAALKAAAAHGLQIVDAHRPVVRNGIGRDVFFDYAHLTPFGYDLLSDVYLEWLRPILLARANEITGETP